MALRAIPAWRLEWAPRAMRCDIVSKSGNPLITLSPASAEGRHTFGDAMTLACAAPKLLAALHSLLQQVEYMGAPDDHPDMIAARAAIAQAEGKE